MEDYRLHQEKCEMAREQLDEWYKHGIRLEAEVSKLAWEFDKWGKGSGSRTAADIVPGKDEAGTLDGRASGEAASGKSKNVEAAKEENIKKWMDFIVGILENGAILSDKLLNSLTAIHTNEAVLAYKLQCGMFDEESRNSPTDRFSNVKVTICFETFESGRLEGFARSRHA
ncbi:unnamed protein product [Cylicocyclus nassatus]|uniref:Uncharacterized protein n=1 Tax=Cylicocyclus nassatus TaxID=53992 RepID=A0AA36GVJ0_CYLNA|nr:unnamed protein product [Cylicocyclus nassatus]